MHKQTTIVSSFIWKFCERIGYVGIQFAVQIVLARILDPTHFGVLSLMIGFTNIAQVFVQNGLNMALVQSKDIQEEDYSSVLFSNIVIMSALYIVLYICAPIIENFYKYTDFIFPFRTLSLILFPGVFISVLTAKLTRELQFKKIFFSSLIGASISGVTGILLAMKGMGIWALIWQQLVNNIINMICLFFVTKWDAKMGLSYTRLKKLIPFAWKMLAGSLANSIYTDLNSMIIGKAFSASSLAFYNKGKSFPQVLSGTVTNTTQSVLLPIMSAKQDERETVKKMLTSSVRWSIFLVTPLLLLMLAASRPIIIILLTEKWATSIPYMQCFCVCFLFMQLHGVFTQTINSCGRSDITLYIQLGFVILNLSMSLIAIRFFDSPIYVAYVSMMTVGLFMLPVDIISLKKLIGYDVKSFLSDISSSLLLSLAVLAVLLLINALGLCEWLTVFLQLFSCILLYTLGARLLHIPELEQLKIYIMKQ